MGQPDALLEALGDQGARELTLVANNAGTGVSGGAAGLIAAGRVRKVVCSYPRSGDPPRAFDLAYRAAKSSRTGSAGNPKRTDALCGSRSRGLLFAGIGWNPACRGQGNPGVQWPPVRAGTALQGDVR